MARPMRALAPVTSAVLTVFLLISRFGVAVPLWAVSYIGVPRALETRIAQGSCAAGAA